MISYALYGYCGIQVLIYPNQLGVFFPEPNPRVLDYPRRRLRQAALLKLCLRFTPE